jgi:hypothetical protein
LGLLVSLVALAGLCVGAVHSARATSVQAGAHQVALARLDVAYYDCLRSQVASLIGPGQSVHVSTNNPGQWATLSKVVAPRDVITTDARSATVVLSLESHSGGCLGSLVQARYANGTVALAHRPTLRGDHGPPNQPL